MKFVLLNFVSSISFRNLFCQMKQRWSRCKTFHFWITQMKIISIQLSIENHFPIAKNLVWKKCSCNFISYLSCFKGQNFKRFGNKNAEKKKWLATFETFELWLSHIDEKVLKRSHGIFFFIFNEDIAIIKCYICILTIYCLNKIYFYQSSDLISCFELKRT